MGAREDLLAAARTLTERGEAPFSPSALIREARAQGCAYKKSTLMTHIVGLMRVGAKNHWGTKYDDFERVGRGKYVMLSDSATRPRVDVEEPAAPRSEEPKSTSETSEDHRAAWYWEGNIQAAIVTHLSAEGWRILRVADTHSREHGVDIEARRDEERLVVEVKGYPSAVYTRGERKGQPKSNNVGAQARAYFSDALLAGLVMRADRPDATVVLAFPEFVTYRNLAERVQVPLAVAGIGIWMVTESGDVVDMGSSEPTSDLPRPGVDLTGNAVTPATSVAPPPPPPVEE